jgi:hypothetical protein
MEEKLVRPHASAKGCVKQIKTQQRQRKGPAPLQTSLPDIVLGLRLVFLLLYYVQIKFPVRNYQQYIGTYRQCSHSFTKGFCK